MCSSRYNNKKKNKAPASILCDSSSSSSTSNCVCSGRIMQGVEALRRLDMMFWGCGSGMCLELLSSWLRIPRWRTTDWIQNDCLKQSQTDQTQTRTGLSGTVTKRRQRSVLVFAERPNTMVRDEGLFVEQRGAGLVSQCQLQQWQLFWVFMTGCCLDGRQKKKASKWELINPNSRKMFSRSSTVLQPLCE